MVLGNCLVWDGDINSLAPERCGGNFQKIIFKLFTIQITHNSSLGTHIDIALWWVPQNLTKEKSILVQVMAWCLQAPSHYLNRCWPRSVSPCGITGPQWVNTLRPEQNGQHFADDISKSFLLSENNCICCKFHWSVFLWSNWLCLMAPSHYQKKS